MLIKTKFEKHISIIKKSTNFIWCKVSKEMLKAQNDLLLCGVYIPPEKSVYFEN